MRRPTQHDKPFINPGQDVKVEINDKGVKFEFESLKNQGRNAFGRYSKINAKPEDHIKNEYYGYFYITGKKPNETNPGEYDIYDFGPFTFSWGKNTNLAIRIYSEDGSFVRPFGPEAEKKFQEDARKQGITITGYTLTTYVIEDELEEIDEEDYEEKQEEEVLPTETEAAKSTEQTSTKYDTVEVKKEETKKVKNKAADITREVFLNEVKTRSEKKYKRIKEYVENEAPWNKEFIDDIDLSSIPYNLNSETIELEIHKEKFKQERSVRAQLKQITDDTESKIDESVQELISKISKAEMSELAHYVALRKTILILFKKSLELNEEGKYSKESAVHDIIFPTKSDSITTSYSKHNLWIIDEKLNFTEYVSSDKPLNGGRSERVDLLIYNHKMMFRGGEEAGNPITIFEFKKPQRDDFVNQSSAEDPVQQIIRYVNDIRAGKFKTPQGRDIDVSKNTPFYGYVVCDLTAKVKEWLFGEKGFKQMPDGKGWYYWFDNINLYIEVISWDKMLKDAELRNKIFFDKLGIN